MKNRYSLIIYIFCFLLGNFYPIQAEIDKVVVTWTPGECIDIACAQNLADQFKKQLGVAQVNISTTQGQAVIDWKPDVPFAWTNIQYPMAALGLYIRTIRVRVRGTISRDLHNNISITSIGDGTILELVSPIQPEKNRYVTKYSPYTHPLTNEQRAQLYTAEANKEVVTIEGPLFEPYRSPPLQLIIESYSSNAEK